MCSLTSGGSLTPRSLIQAARLVFVGEHRLGARDASDRSSSLDQFSLSVFAAQVLRLSLAPSNSTQTIALAGIGLRDNGFLSRTGTRSHLHVRRVYYRTFAVGRQSQGHMRTLDASVTYNRRGRAIYPCMSDCQREGDRVQRDK